MTERVRFTVIPGDSTVHIHANSSIHPIDGEAQGIEGTIEFAMIDGEPDLDEPVEASVELVASQLTSGNQAYDAEMRRRIDVRRYPKISGTMTKVAAASGGDYDVTGNLTFHGATRTVNTVMNVNVSEDTLTADWEQTIDIRDFNMKPPKVLMFKVDPEVRVEVHLVAEKE